MRTAPIAALSLTLSLAALSIPGCYSSKSGEQPPPSPRAVAPCPEPAITAPQTWRHSWKSAASSSLVGESHHAVSDAVVNPGQSAKVRGKFAYGATSKDLEDEDATLYIQTAACGRWAPVTTVRTNGDGRASFAIPALTIARPGAYPFQVVVHGDRTRAYGTIFVVAPSTRAVLFDIDGTLTSSDAQLAKQVLLGDDPSMRPGADNVAQAYANAGYMPIYITGRPYFLREASRDWLRRQGFPRGVLITTDSLGQSKPSRASVGAFKQAQIKRLTDEAGVSIAYAYGNAGTDLCAYLEAGISPAVTFIIGKHAGQACGGAAKTQKIKDYRRHLKVLPIR